MSLIKKNELFLLEEIVKKNFTSKYKDSVLGIFWTLLSPLLLMALFTIIFSTLFSRNIENFPVYFLCGWCLYIFFNSAINMSMVALKGNKNILQRTPAPKHIFVLAAIISEFLNFLITLMLLVCVMIITGAPFYWFTIPFAILPVLSLFIMMTGLGFILSIVAVYYADVIHLWKVISMMFMYGSGIFYPMSIIPEPYRSILVLNPLYWAIDLFKCFVYHGIFPKVGYIVNSMLLSLIIVVIGIIVFIKFERKITIRL